MTDRHDKMSANGDRKLCHILVSSIAEALISGLSDDKILDMFQRTSNYQQVICKWRHPDNNLNLLDLAILCKRLPIVRHLCKKETSVLLRRPLCASDGTLVNNPLHTACKVGALDLIQYLLSVESEDANMKLLQMPTYISLEGKLSGTGEPKLPLELCLEGGHLDCGIFLCKYILCHSVYKDKTEQSLVLKSSPLHQACHLGSADLVRLILDRSVWGQYINAYDSSGFTPLHIAAKNGSSSCLQVLLEHGAYVNVYAKCHSVLHMLYSNKQRPFEFIDCTKLLIQYGVDVNASDHNENTPLDYIAYEFGQKWTGSMVTEQKAVYWTRSSQQPSHDSEQTNHRRILLETMDMLLGAGAHTHTVISHTPDGVLVDHTTIHTLLQNTGWPLSLCLMNSARDVYDALELLLSRGCDPNVLAKHSLTSSFTTLLLQSLHEVQEAEEKCRFVHLFIMHGVDLDCIVPPPRHFRKHPTKCIWSVRPVMLALQEKHPISVVLLMLNYMTRDVINEFLNNPKMRNWQMYILQLECNNAYRKEWLQAKKCVRKSVRRLKHICKLNILKSVGRRASNVQLLPLPKMLKTYLCDLQC